MTIWGDHSATQYPDLYNALVRSERGRARRRPGVAGSSFLPTVQKRGAAIIEARGASSAASAANATVEHMRDWVLGTPEGDWVSMSVPSDGSYGVPEGLISSFACTTRRRIRDRAGSEGQRLLPGQDRRQRGRAHRGARRGPRDGSDRLATGIRSSPSCVTLVAMTESHQPNPFSREGSSPSDGLSSDDNPEQGTPYQPLDDGSNGRYAS